MVIDSNLEQDVMQGWSEKEQLVLRVARVLGQQLWDHDPMYGTTRDRDDHEAKIAQIGFLLGKAESPIEFLESARQIPTLRG